MTDYRVGDTPWHATYRHHNENRITCPVCYGQLKVTLILGNDDEVVTPCSYCAPGYERPRGWAEEYAPYAAAEQVTITAVEIRETAEGTTREYRADHCIYHTENLFDTEAEANARATELGEAERVRRETQAEYIKGKVEKDFTWNVGYHMREARNFRKKIEYHERMAVLCKARAKDSFDAD